MADQMLPGQLRRWRSRALPSGVLTEGDLITIISINSDPIAGETVTYVSRHGRGETYADIIEKYSEALG